MFVSIKRLIEQSRQRVRPDDDLLQAALQTARLLLDAIATHMVRGREADFRVFARTLKGLLRKMDEPPSALNLLGIASEAAEALETHA